QPLRIAEYVTLRSLPATVLDLLGIDAAGRIPGESMAALWRGTGAPPSDPLVASVRQGLDVAKHAPNHDGDVHALTVDGRHFILTPGGREERFDLRSDPAGVRDLGASAESAAVIAGLRAALLRLVPSAGVVTAEGGS